ncbi:hypothetical protein CS022_02500 [Veronia nyctiphanis]|uniref:Uncharacterized protein n=1 Tax=Veronia nyctiphanis TaxID=1278244 RepID=A0A4V1LTA1_9GAMM|nr:hypothetical protein [Veronia nyctiphanis]RXJ74478.1 hypothetical protein CS022_02500 [Veronia nyctiphanis]
MAEFAFVNEFVLSDGLRTLKCAFFLETIRRVSMKRSNLVLIIAIFSSSAFGWQLIEQDEADLPTVYIRVECNSAEQLIIASHPLANEYYDIYGQPHETLDKAARISCQETPNIELQ